MVSPIGEGQKAEGAPNIPSRCNSGTKFLEGAFYGGEAHLRRHSDCYRPTVGALDYFSFRSVNRHRLGRHRPDIPLLRYVATIINTGTTIITFLMVFIIQNTQNRDGAAVQAKLDELIRVSSAQNALIGIEHLTEDEISEIREKCLARVKKPGGVQKNANKKARAAINKTV